MLVECLSRMHWVLVSIFSIALSKQANEIGESTYKVLGFIYKILAIFYILENKMKTLKNMLYDNSLQHTHVLCNRKVFREDLECTKLKYWGKTWGRVMEAYVINIVRSSPFTMTDSRNSLPIKIIPLKKYQMAAKPWESRVQGDEGLARWLIYWLA